MLDTNVVSASPRGRAPDVVAKLRQTPRSRVCISIVTAMELRFGLAKNPQARARPAVEAFLRVMPIRYFPTGIARSYGKIRAQLERQGHPIGSLDMMIAAHAISARAELVTYNVREFSRVEGLDVVTW